MSPRDDDRPPSRTRLKKDAQALQALGVELASLPAEVLDGLSLPENLRHALDELGRIQAHGALRRQRQYVGRLMREVDPEPLRDAVEATRRPARDEARRFKAAEAWRERLVSAGDEAVAQFAAEHPGVDHNALGKAVADARAGLSGAARRLFRLIRRAMEPEPGPSGDGR